MGTKLNALLGRRSSKLYELTKLAVSRAAILKKLHNVRCTQAEGDAVQLLRLGHQERALVRVEYAIMEQNALNAVVLIEIYCRCLAESSDVVQNSRECPNELKAEISGLIFAASRLGDFPELQEIRHLFTSKFGEEFAANAVGLRNNCGVHTEIVQGLSRQPPSLESRQKLLKQLSDNNGVIL